MNSTQLSEMLRSTDVATRRSAVEYLSQHPDTAVDMAIEIVQAIGDSDRQVMEYAVATLEELGEALPHHLARLAGLVTNKNSDVQYWAVTLLGRSGTAAAEYALALGNLVASNAAPQVRERAAWAIERIGPAAACVRSQLESCRNAAPSSLGRAVARALEAIRQNP